MDCAPLTLTLKQRLSAVQGEEWGAGSEDGTQLKSAPEVDRPQRMLHQCPPHQLPVQHETSEDKWVASNGSTLGLSLA